MYASKIRSKGVVLVYCALLFESGAYCGEIAWTLQFKEGASAVEFLAIGRPSALRIRGRSKQAQGSFRARKDGTGLLLEGKVQLSLESLDTGIAKRDAHMKERYFETARYPLTELEVAGLSLPAEFAAGTAHGKVPFKGTLSLHGVKRAIEGTLDASRSEDAVSAKGEFSIKLSDFKIEIPSFMGNTVAEDVQISVEMNGAFAPASAR